MAYHSSPFLLRSTTHNLCVEGSSPHIACVSLGSRGKAHHWVDGVSAGQTRRFNVKENMTRVHDATDNPSCTQYCPLFYLLALPKGRLKSLPWSTLTNVSTREVVELCFRRYVPSSLELRPWCPCCELAAFHQVRTPVDRPCKNPSKIWCFMASAFGRQNGTKQHSSGVNWTAWNKHI